MRIAVDIDGTLTKETDGTAPDVYPGRTPRQVIISQVNNLYDRGHEIILFTARYEEDREITLEWLKKHNVKFHELILNKPQYDIILDDKAVNPNDRYYYEAILCRIK